MEFIAGLAIGMIVMWCWCSQGIKDLTYKLNFSKKYVDHLHKEKKRPLVGKNGKVILDSNGETWWKGMGDKPEDPWIECDELGTPVDNPRVITPS